MRILVIILFSLFSCASYAQKARMTVNDMNREAMDERIPERINIDEHLLDRTDIEFSKTIWRVVALDSAENRVLSSIVDVKGTEYSIIDLLFKLALDDDVKAIVNPGHVDVLEKEQLERYHSVVDTVTTFSVNRLVIQEQWLYDKYIKKMIVRINYVALAYESETGSLKPLFWLIYHELRKHGGDYFIKEKVKAWDGRKKKVSLNEFFEARLFSSKLIKVSKWEKPLSISPPRGED